MAGYGITDAYTKSQVSSATEVNSALSQKADAATTSSATEVATALSGKQDTLVSGTNIKTINNTSLLGSGNITIQGGSGANVVELTQAEYDALVTGQTVDPDTFYIITDATEININNYYTKTQTSSSTEIATALNAKQNALSAGTGIDITNDVISVTGGGGSATVDQVFDRDSANAIANSAVTRNTVGRYANGSTGGLDLIMAYDQKGYGIDSLSLVSAKINDRRIISTYSSRSSLTNFSLVETSAITTSLSSSSTDSQVPSAKAVYDAIGDIESLLSAI